MLYQSEHSMAVTCYLVMSSRRDCHGPLVHVIFRAIPFKITQGWRCLILYPPIINQIYKRQDMHQIEVTWFPIFKHKNDCKLTTSPIMWISQHLSSWSFCNASLHVTSSDHLFYKTKWIWQVKCCKYLLTFKSQLCTLLEW